MACGQPSSRILATRAMADWTISAVSDGPCTSCTPSRR